MWKSLARSEPGTSHARTGETCQDSHVVTRYGSDGSTLIAICSDGAGSASHSAIGSRAACDTLLSLVAEHLNQPGAPIPSDALVTEWYRRTRDVLLARAKELTILPRQLACTLLLAVVGPDWSVFAQLGDGVIVVDEPEGYRAITWPQNGEYQNTTFFLTEDGFASHVVVVITSETISEVALMTDGLQTLALNFAKQTAHAPFFTPFFRKLRTAEDGSNLEVPFLQFLQSSAVNDRTDDDKTLVLATRLEE